MNRVTQRVEEWKRKIVDLSRRNRLLYFARTRGSTLKIKEGARPQSSGWNLIRCGGVFFPFLTAYYVVRQEAPDDHFLKGSSRETRATQGWSGSDQRSPSRFSHRAIPQVWQAELPLCAERLPGTRPLLLADSCQRW